jgi:HTH-type transcriptional regulator/antitoxin HigA
MRKRNRAAALIDDEYFTLVREFPLKPIESEKELDQATAIINRLVDRGFDDLTAGEDAYLDVLSDLTKKYEDEHHPIEDVTESEMLAYLIENKGVTQRAVADATGIPESTISDLLAARRNFNRGHIEKLAPYFGVSPAVFFKDRKRNGA